MNKSPNKKKQSLTVEELIKRFEEFSKENDVKEVSKEEFEKNLKKLSTPKRDKK